MKNSLIPKILFLKDYRNLYIAGLISELGSFVTETALLLLVFQLSNNDNSTLGVIRVVFLFSLTIGSILGGPIGLKFSRKNVLIFSNLMRIPLVFILMFAESYPLIIAINGAIAFFTGIFNPSRQTLVNEIVPKEDINKANSLFGSTMAILHLIGPFLGAYLFSFFNGVKEVLFFDLTSYVVGIALILLISTKTSKGPLTEKSRTSFLFDLKEGFQYALSRLDLCAIYLNGIIAGFCIGLLIPLLLPFVKSILGESQEFYGLLLSAFGFGGIFGGILANRLSAKISNGKIITVCMFLEPVMMIIWLLQANYYLSLASFFFWGILVFTRIPTQLNYMSHSIPMNFLSRSHSLLDLTFVIPNISGGLLVAFIGNDFPVDKILWCTAFIFLFLNIVRLFGKEMSFLYKSEV